ncbi:MAG: cytochrome c [Planctomycetes bacterium]|nr:cytochrome c [Planctomycetota bacterium]
MSKVRLAFAAVAAAGLVAFVLSADRGAGAQVAKGKTRPASTKFLMRGISQAHCKGVADLLKDAGPADDKAWENVACHAACLSELSFALMQDGRCPDGTWAGAAKSLGEGAAAVIAAGEKKELEAARTAFKTVTDSCKSCHDAHRKQK